jgi:hypothetical protein
MSIMYLCVCHMYVNCLSLCVMCVFVSVYVVS